MKTCMLIIIIILLNSCAETSSITKYKEYLENSNVNEITYNQVCGRLGQPSDQKEYGKEIVACWIDRKIDEGYITYTKNSSGDIKVQSYRDDRIAGCKIIITFDKKNMNIIKWTYTEL